MAKASYTRYDAEMNSVKFQINHWLSHSRLIDRHRVAAVDRRVRHVEGLDFPDRRHSGGRRASDQKR